METTDCKHPEVEVQLSGEDGNAFVIIGRVRGALSRTGVSKQEINEFTGAATAGSYDDLLATCHKWVTVL